MKTKRKLKKLMVMAKKASRKTLINNADKALSRYTRLLQAVKQNGYVYCRTCQEAYRNGSNRIPEPMYWKGEGAQCGHYMPKGNGATAVRWTPHNCHVQDAYCNTHKSGNLAEYTRFMDRTYGQEITDDLRRRKHQPVKYTDDEIKEIADLYNELSDELERRL